ncbi:HMG-box [Basidiobolus meristosporus CBS 931.73]|uniref:HMG-box n=1 Tax=Basidiobolus meristosporus CBS 931.73 TaxID=1314790 RepID=A0A1Y1YF68_9FUNG|nr:HMG-box [Basidiobolus meristosporus CBS 931.73]|eukprot:ORX96627.1 HMG-box [Basidiobolus meristosporus CBS 931.73]
MEVQEFLKKCGLEQYTEAFLAEGFDQLRSLFEITESDLVALDVKRGHRRLIQREINAIKGSPFTPPFSLSIGANENPFMNLTGADPRAPNLFAKNLISSTPPNGNQKIFFMNPKLPIAPLKSSPPSTESNSNKRRYRRHPKPDKNAPEKPPSAYVMFSNKVRAEFKDQNMSFTDMAKIVGDRWKSLSPEEKEDVDQCAAKAKQEYTEALEAYKKTPEYKEYQEYLVEFRAKSSSCVRPVGRPRKHPKPDEIDNSVPSDDTNADDLIYHDTSSGRSVDHSSWPAIVPSC